MTTTEVPLLSQAISVSSRNCEEVVGKSWDWTLGFARAHGVPVARLGRRVTLILARELLVALAQHGVSVKKTRAERLADALREDEQ